MTVQSGSASSEGARECVPLTEVRARLDALTNEEYRRLVLYAQSYSLGGRLAARDLLHGAILSALDGTKPLPVGVNLLSYLRLSMRNIASNDLKKARRFVLVPVGGDVAGTSDLLGQLPDAYPNCEEALTSAPQGDAAVQAAYEAFSDDEEAQLVLMLRLEGRTPDDICLELSVSRTKYDSINRRISRKLPISIQPGRVL